MIDLSQSYESIQNRLNALKTYKEVSDAEKQLKEKASDSLSESIDNLASQLSSIDILKKRYERDSENSMDRLMNLLSITRGNGSTTMRYIRKKILEASAKLEPKAREILSEETIKALGCSQEQTYLGIPKTALDNNVPPNVGIYIPVKSIDLFGNLKNEPESKVGKIFYEKATPSTNVDFKPYGGKEPYPFNKMLYDRMTSQNVDRTYKKQYGQFYNGTSGQNLLDITYTKQNSLGVSGDYFRVFLLNREDTPQDEDGNPVNKVGQFLQDYYSTIKIIDTVDITSQLINLITGAVNIKAQVGLGDIGEQNKFSLIVQRILGLCSDDRKEIDVSGIAKIAELDGVDESFWELNEIDLRKSDKIISNTQNKVIEFEDCDNVIAPVNVETLIDELIEFRETFNDLSVEQTVKQMEKVLDSISQNPNWSALGINNININVSIDKNIIKKIPLAIAGSILSPKVLLPIFLLLRVLEQGAKNEAQNIYDEVIDSSQVNNLVSSPSNFLKKFKQFNFGVITRLNNEFLKILFELLKQDIINLLNSVIRDIGKSSLAKKYTIYIRLIQLALVIIPAISDYRKCKSLLDDILKLLNLINSSVLGNKPPISLLSLAALLPGTSPERAAINSFEFAQSVGLPTGPLPDGSPNMMNQIVLSMIKGIDKEENENGNVWIQAGPYLGVGKKG